MARKVFFSFHYDDILAVNVVRKANAFTAKYEPASRSFFDKSIWEEVKKRGDTAIKADIDKGLNGSSVTCVLVGTETWARPWVRYEILASLERGNGLFGIHIHDVGPNSGLGLLYPTMIGKNPFEYVAYVKNGNGLLSTVDLLHKTENGWKPHPHKRSCSVAHLPRFANLTDRSALSQFAQMHGWKSGSGRENVSEWIEAAANAAGRFNWL